VAEERATPAISPVAPQQITPPGKTRSGVLTDVVVGAVVVGALYFGREVLIPITLAILLSFVLSPLMELLRRLWLPRVVAALFAVLIAIGVITALGGIIGTQIAGLAGQVPQYQTTVETKVESLQKLLGSAFASRLGGLMHNIEGAGQPQQKPPAPPTQQPSSEGTPEQPEGSKPVPVVITQTPASSALDLSRRILEPIVAPIADLGIILVVAIFTLLQKEDLRDRLVRLFGSGDLHRTTAAMDDAGRRLTRYFLTQLGINCTFGAIVGLGLYLIGVPSPVLWGVLGALLRFVPYIGSYIAAALPTLLAAAVGNGWSIALWTALLYIATELIMGQAVEPVVYGHSTGLSPFSVIIAAIFWTWMWGPIGLILSEWQGEAPVLCVAGRGPLDEVASVMLAQLLEKHDIGVRVLPHEAVSRTKIAALDPEGVAMVCIPYLDITGSPAHLRFLVRRLRQRLPKASVLVGIWAAGDVFLRDQASRRVIGADYYVSSLREALNACLAAVHNPAKIALHQPKLELVPRSRQGDQK